MSHRPGAASRLQPRPPETLNPKQASNNPGMHQCIYEPTYDAGGWNDHLHAARGSQQMQRDGLQSSISRSGRRPSASPRPHPQKWSTRAAKP